MALSKVSSIVERINGAEALLKSLKKERVEVIFGIPGGATIPIYDVLYDFEGIRHILARHEQCAAHMADGYARASGKVGVCIATSGPGATNLVTGIATAYMDSSPLVAITGQVPTNMIGKDAFQETDIVGITASITKHSLQPRSPKEVPAAVKEAFYVASTWRPGPVLIDMPKDVQVNVEDVHFPGKVSLRGYKPDKLKINLNSVKEASTLLNKAEKPFILAGGGVIISNASKELLELSEHLNAPVATTLMGKGCFPENHPLSLGVIGMHGTYPANLLVSRSDVILAVGMRFSDRTVGNFEAFAPDSKIIHLDISEAEINKNIKVEVSVIADAKRGLKEICKQIKALNKPKQRKDWKELVSKFKEKGVFNFGKSKGKIYPPQLLKILRTILPKKAIAVTEVGQNQAWAALYFKIYHPRTFITSGGLGTMGFGFPAALGAKVAKPEVPVVDIAGDGSFLMTSQDLATSVTEEIPVIVIILDNRALGMVAQWQRLFYNRRYSHTYLNKVPDFVQYAKSFGAEGIQVESYEDFKQAIREGLSNEVTTVIDVPIPKEENVFPMVPPGKELEKLIMKVDET